MNGRVYDYNVGRFMSVDPFIQEPGNSQSINPYSYIMNNPLSGTDPTGYVGSRIKRKDPDPVQATVSQEGNTTKVKLTGGTAKQQKAVQNAINNGAKKIGFKMAESSGKVGTLQSRNTDNSANQSFGAPIYNDNSANGGEFDSYTSELTDLGDRKILSGDIEVSKKSITGETTAISILDGKITRSKEAKVEGLAISFVESTDEKGQTTDSLQVARGPFSASIDEKGKLEGAVSIPLPNDMAVTTKVGADLNAAVKNRNNYLERLVRFIQNCDGGSGACGF